MGNPLARYIIAGGILVLLSGVIYDFVFTELPRRGASLDDLVEYSIQAQRGLTIRLAGVAVVTAGVFVTFTTLVRRCCRRVAAR